MPVFQVKWFNLRLGYGFLFNPQKPSQDIVVFAEELQDLKPPTLFAGDIVQCELLPPRAVKESSVRKKYGPVAHNVRIVRRFSES